MGLTVAEAARIQPTYCESVPRAVCFCPFNDSSESVVIGTFVAPDSEGSALFRVTQVLAGTKHNVGDIVLAYTPLHVESTMLAFQTGVGDVGFPVPNSWGYCPAIGALGQRNSTEMVELLLSSDCRAGLIAKDPWYGEDTCTEPTAGPRGYANTQSESGAFGCAYGASSESPMILVLLGAALVAVRRRKSR